jgi:hypothetical protein
MSLNGLSTLVANLLSFHAGAHAMRPLSLFRVCPLAGSMRMCLWEDVCFSAPLSQLGGKQYWALALFFKAITALAYFSFTLVLSGCCLPHAKLFSGATDAFVKLQAPFLIQFRQSLCPLAVAAAPWFGQSRQKGVCAHTDERESGRSSLVARRFLLSLSLACLH